MTEKKWEKWIPMGIFGTIMIIVYMLIANVGIFLGALGTFIRTISPFLFSILIVYLLYMPCKKLELALLKSKFAWVAKKARLLSVMIVYFLLICVIILGIRFIVPVIISSILELANNIPEYMNGLLAWAEGLPDDSMINKETLMSGIESLFSNFLTPEFLENVTNGILGLASGVINLVISLTVSLYFLIDRENIKKFFDRLVRTFVADKHRKVLYRYLEQINHVGFTFIASKGLDSIINWVTVTAILLIFGVEYAILLGIIAGIANFIPYLGSLIAVISIIAFTAITGDLAQTLGVAVCLIIFQQLDGNFIEPKIMGKTLKMSPILVIFAVIVGGAYFGLIGMFLGVPVAAIIKQVFIEYVDNKNENKKDNAKELTEQEGTS